MHLHSYYHHKDDLNGPPSSFASFLHLSGISSMRLYICDWSIAAHSACITALRRFLRICDPSEVMKFVTFFTAPFLYIFTIVMYSLLSEDSILILRHRIYINFVCVEDLLEKTFDSFITMFEIIFLSFLTILESCIIFYMDHFIILKFINLSNHISLKCTYRNVKIEVFDLSLVGPISERILRRWNEYSILWFRDFWISAEIVRSLACTAICRTAYFDALR